VQDPDLVRFTAANSGSSRTSEGKIDATHNKPQATQKYKRVLPIKKIPPRPANTAILYLSKDHTIGKGHQSQVYRSKIQVPNHFLNQPSVDETPKYETETFEPIPRASVAAKLSFSIDSDLGFLRNEGEFYSALRRDIFEHWTGMSLVPGPLRSTPAPLGAVVSQFYGYYEPIHEEENKLDSDDAESGGGESEKRKKPVASPILLLEECGEPIYPSLLCEDDQCVTLVSFNLSLNTNSI